MKRFLYLFLAGALFSCQQPAEQKGKFTISRGVNASHWLAQSENRGAERQAYMTEKDFALIAEMGFDHVRLPLEEMQLWDEQGNKQQEAFSLMHFAIEQCQKNNLRIIADLHILRSHHFNELADIALWNDTVAQQNYIQCWRQLSAEMSKYPDSLVAYEPLNEAVADDSEDWNRLINWVVSEIRLLEPTRTIVMGSNRWQSAGTFKDLQIPENDTNIILSFHFYSPLAFTHHDTPWSEFKELGVTTTYPGWTIDTVGVEVTDDAKRETIKNFRSYCTKDTLEMEIMQAVEVAKAHGLQLFCGEFGCFPTTDMDSRVRWFTDVVDIFSRHNIAWSIWNYKNDFPIVDEQTLLPIKEITSVLMK